MVLVNEGRGGFDYSGQDMLKEGLHARYEPIRTI